MWKTGCVRVRMGCLGGAGSAPVHRWLEFVRAITWVRGSYTSSDSETDSISEVSHALLGNQGT